MLSNGFYPNLLNTIINTDRFFRSLGCKNNINRIFALKDVNLPIVLSLLTTKNRFHVASIILGRRTSGNAVFLNGDIFSSLSQENLHDFLIDLYLRRNRLDIDLKNGVLNFNVGGKDFSFIANFKNLRAIQETFFLGQYDAFDVSGKFIFDIGANIGDTIIRFLSCGAEYVVGFEPFPSLFNLARKNISLNNCQNKSCLVQAGIDSQNGFVFLPQDGANTQSKLSSVKNGAIIVPIFSLETMYQKYKHLFKGKKVAVKIDCEGMEYEILDTLKKNISLFDEYFLEYHHGAKNLIRKFKDAGFKVSVSKYSTVSIALGQKHPFLMTGLIHATK